MDITVILVLFLLFCVTFIFTRTPINLPPGHFNFPFIGSIFLLRKLSKRKNYLVFADEGKKYGSVFRWYLGNQMCVVLSDIDVITEALVEKGEIFSDRPKIKGGMPKEKGIVWRNYGNQWRHLRKFTGRVLRDFGVGKTSIEERIKTEIETVCGIIEAADGRPVPLSELMRKFVGNVNHEIIFGKRMKYDDPELERITNLSEVLNRGSLFSVAAFLPAFLAKIVNKKTFEYEEKRKGILVDVGQYIGEQIEEHRETFDPANIRDFLDIYLDAEKDQDSFINKQNIFWVIVDLFVAGSETTKTSLSWALLYLVEFPKVQEKCQKEIDKEICGTSVQYSDRNRLAYMNAFIMEVHRHSCIAPLNLPHCSSEDATLAGYTIPKGTVIFPMQYSVSRDPRLFKDPEVFDPERFIDANGDFKGSIPYVPFSIGRRVCLGEGLAKTEMFLALTNLLQKFTFLREDPNTPLSLEPDDIPGLNCPLPFKIRAVKR